MSTVPTDSILRRHFEQMHQAGDAGAPEDSILRRHHEQMRLAASAPAPKPASPPPREQAAPAAASRPAAAPEPAARPAAAPAPASGNQGGGFFGWLKRLFGG